MNIRPLNDRITIDRFETEHLSEGGILLASQAEKGSVAHFSGLKYTSSI